mgnify:CR=1 FL=1
MPRRQVANYDFGTLATLTTGSTDGTWTFLGTPWSIFTVTGIFSSGKSGTVKLRGARSSGSTAAMAVILATIDNTTQIGYNSSAIPVSWVQARATAISTGGNASAITVNLLAAG